METGLDTILELAAGGDQAAWRRLVEAYGPRVFGLIRARCGDVDLAEEITQAVFCTVAAKIGGEAGGYVERGRFEAWLFRVAMNRLRDEIRRRKRRPSAPGDEYIDRVSEDKSPEDEPVASENLAALREAMDQLSDADRRILELRHVGELSYKQISELLDEPLGTVLARQHRALRKLKRILSDRITLA